MKKTLIAILTVLLIITVAIGCRQAERVSYNLSQQADNFNILRKITVINIRTDTVLFQATGNFSVLKSQGDIDIIGEAENEMYYKHFVDYLPRLSI